jgi:hypothetical protein
MHLSFYTAYFFKHLVFSLSRPIGTHVYVESSHKNLGKILNFIQAEANIQNLKWFFGDENSNSHNTIVQKITI